jgi:hypothetical protein
MDSYYAAVFQKDSFMHSNQTSNPPEPEKDDAQKSVVTNGENKGPLVEESKNAALAEPDKNTVDKKEELKQASLSAALEKEAAPKIDLKVPQKDKESFAAESGQKLQETLPTESKQNQQESFTVKPEQQTTKQESFTAEPELKQTTKQEPEPLQPETKSELETLATDHSERELLKEYFANKAHTYKANIEKSLDKKVHAANENFHILFEHNKNEAEKTKHNNEQFEASIDLACLVNQIYLILYFERNIEQMISTSHEQEIEMRRATAQQNLEATEPPQHVSLLPKEKTSDAINEHKIALLATAHTVREEIKAKQEVVEKRIENEWGSLEWKPGLVKQVEKLTNHMVENKQDFINVIKTPEAAAKRELTAEENKKVTAVLADVAKNFKEFLLERTEPVPTPTSTPDAANSKIIIGRDAPPAPPMTTRSVIIGTSAPMAPAPPTAEEYAHIIGEPKHKIIRRTQAEIDAEIFLINEARQGYSLLGKPIIEEVKKVVSTQVVDEETADAKSIVTNVDENSNMRLAMRYAGVVAKDITALEHSIHNFANDKSALQDLRAMEKTVDTKIAALEQALTAEHTPTRPRSH